MRLNLGCGPCAAAGWLNCDVKATPGVGLRFDLRRGLPLADASIETAAAIHVLQDLRWDEIAPALAELRRVLKRGGVLRLAVPDLERALAAHLAEDVAYFYVPDEHARTLGAKLVTQIVWYGSVRTPFTYEFLCEWLQGAGFAEVRRSSFGTTQSGDPALCALDNRERETLFVEAR